MAVKFPARTKCGACGSSVRLAPKNWRLELDGEIFVQEARCKCGSLVVGMLGHPEVCHWLAAELRRDPGCLTALEESTPLH